MQKNLKQNKFGVQNVILEKKPFSCIDMLPCNRDQKL